MHWFRLNIRLGCRLALLTLTLQQVLSFAHVHAPGFTPASAILAAVAAGAASPGTAHPIDKSDRSVDADCLICALIQMAATSPPAAAPALPLPGRIAAINLHALAELALAAAPRWRFQARAPPAILIAGGTHAA